MTERILILDFGSQFTQLIARRLRELRVYCEIQPCTIDTADLLAFQADAIILSGGPASAAAEGSPEAHSQIFALGKPVLGICYGEQAICAQLGGAVEPSSHREFGRAEIELMVESPLFDGLLRVGEHAQVWMSHGDKITALPDGFHTLARTNASPFAAIADEERQIYGVQFHPEVVHTEIGKGLLSNFCFRIAGLRGDWSMAAYRLEAERKVRERVGDKNVICGLSGGVDSAVTALLLHESIGDQLTCVFVDTGLMRKGEAEEVVNLFRGPLQYPSRPCRCW